MKIFISRSYEKKGKELRQRSSSREKDKGTIFLFTDPKSDQLQEREAGATRSGPSS